MNFKPFTSPIFLLIIIQNVFGQANNFEWIKTTSSPSDGVSIRNLCIATLSGEELLVGSTSGIYRSDDQGKSWLDMGSPDLPIFKIISSGSQIIGLSSESQLLISHDTGTSWFTRNLPVKGITDITFTPTGRLLASSGHLIVVNGSGRFRGEGLFKSDDGGLSWEPIDIPAIDGFYISHLAKDSKGSIYLSTNEYGVADAGLYYSEDDGGSWSKMPDLSFDWGQGEIEKTNMVVVTAMTVTPDDSLLVCINGNLGKIATSVNLINSLEGIKKGAKWEHLRVVPFGYDWFYLEIHQVFYTKHGDIYAARSGESFSLSGIFANLWQGDFFRTDMNPVIFPDGSFAYQPSSFAQLRDGSVFTLQMLDQNIYFTTASQREEELPLDVSPAMNLTVYPNPSAGLINLEFPSQVLNGSIALINSNGTEVMHHAIQNSSKVALDASALAPGYYFLRVDLDSKSYSHRLQIL